MADFISMLFDEGISISTIIGLYRSSVAAINTGFDNEETISNPVFLSRLMRAFSCRSHQLELWLPKWDLPRVLRALAKAPFELMHKCSILNLSVKNALRFLLAVASGA